ncbi:MAG: hypothetical protein KDK65_05410, partial [Chlamydiia bacterium]|nr:hypothetical protein [Chlamydiia bacterium]
MEPSSSFAREIPKPELLLQYRPDPAGPYSAKFFATQPKLTIAENKKFTLWNMTSPPSDTPNPTFTINDLGDNKLLTTIPNSNEMLLASLQVSNLYVYHGSVKICSSEVVSNIEIRGGEVTQLSYHAESDEIYGIYKWLGGTSCFKHKKSERVSHQGCVIPSMINPQSYLVAHYRVVARLFATVHPCYYNPSLTLSENLFPYKVELAAKQLSIFSPDEDIVSESQFRLIHRQSIEADRVSHVQFFGRNVLISFEDQVFYTRNFQAGEWKCFCAKWPSPVRWGGLLSGDLAEKTSQLLFACFTAEKIQLLTLL